VITLYRDSIYQPVASLVYGIDIYEPGPLKARLWFVRIPVWFGRLLMGLR
jgi:hypothetical protein